MASIAAKHKFPGPRLHTSRNPLETLGKAGELNYEHEFRDRLLKRIQKQVAVLGIQLTPAPG
jgi:hypothetical protein